MMQLGPFHITNEISIGSILTIFTILYTSVKYLGHFVRDFKVRNERLDKMWLKFNGDYEDDPNGWFNRLECMEGKVNSMWQRLSFNRLVLDDVKTRRSDV